MSKQIYIDSNGNEVQVSGTVNTADMMPMSGNDSTKVSEVIGNLSDLTTTDKSSLVGAVNEIASYTPVYGNTASGSIATFDTSLALPLQDCTIAINAVQESGTPTPSSPKAISGFTGANIVNISGEDNDLVTYIRNIYLETYGLVDLGSLNWTKNTSFANTLFITNITGKKTNNSNCLCAHYVNGGIATGGTFLNNMQNNNFASDTSNGIYIRDDSKASLSGDDFKTAMSGVYLVYELATPTTPSITSAQLSAICNSFDVSGSVISITWQSEAGTVYGGSLDVTSGKLTVTHGIITFDGSGDEIWNDGTIRYSIEISDCERTAGRLEVLCNRGVFSSSGGSEGNVFATNKYLYYYPPTSITSLADFKTWLGSNNLVVVYPLATPITYQLTPTQISSIVGTNNIFGDTNGNTSVVYACSLKDYIDGQ